MAKNLVIVESPAKAKTISKYLGADFEVKSSMGHIRGIPSKSGSVDVKNNFKPKYAITPGKSKLLAELKKASKAADSVWLASDEDREGEAIAWHLAEILGLDPKTTKRIVFHEITKPALDAAVKNPRTIDLPLVESQQARQTLDYLVGFELSPVLWRKVRTGLSAGRVQSVALRLLVEREQEIENHKPKSSFKVFANFSTADGAELKAEITQPFNDLSEVKKVFENWLNANFKITKVNKRPAKRSPTAPFTTSTLQQIAGSNLGYSPKLVMQLAQKLYEAGQITYMRTDSVNLSKLAQDSMKKYIISEFGEKYVNVRNYKTTSAGAQEAHEAIRPTDITKTLASSDPRQQKLYNLIWRRALSSQMSAAELSVSTLDIESSTGEVLISKGEILTFDGFYKVWGRTRDDKILPDLKLGDKLSLVGAISRDEPTKITGRFSESSLVRELERRGIGRPSTYATTISTIQSRNYAERGDIVGTPRQVDVIKLEKGKITLDQETIEYGKEQNKLKPTSIGIVVSDFLTKNFSKILDYDFTKEVEAELDQIAEQKKDKLEVLNSFYQPFHGAVEASASVSRAEANQARLVGNDPKSGAPIYARFGKFGPMLQKGENDDENKPTFAPLPSGAKIETVSLEQALKMFDLPRNVGKTEAGDEITAAIGRFGPYIKIGSKFVSIKPLTPFEITEAQARQLYKEKMDKQAAQNIADLGEGIKILDGRFGPYITNGKVNARIPKGTDPKQINLAEAKKLLDDAKTRKPKRRRKLN